MSSNLSLFSDDCERIGSFSSSFFLIQQVISRVVSLLSWPAYVGSLKLLPSSLAQDLRPARILGEFSSSRDVDQPGQSAGLLLSASERRAPSRSRHSSPRFDDVVCPSYRIVPPIVPCDTSRRQRSKTLARGLGLPPNRPRAPNCALLTNYQIM